MSNEEDPIAAWLRRRWLHRGCGGRWSRPRQLDLGRSARGGDVLELPPSPPPSSARVDGWRHLELARRSTRAGGAPGLGSRRSSGLQFSDRMRAEVMATLAQSDDDLVAPSAPPRTSSVSNPMRAAIEATLAMDDETIGELVIARASSSVDAAARGSSSVDASARSSLASAAQERGLRRRPFLCSDASAAEISNRMPRRGSRTSCGATPSWPPPCAPLPATAPGRRGASPSPVAAALAASRPRGRRRRGNKGFLSGSERPGRSELVSVRDDESFVEDFDENSATVAVGVPLAQEGQLPSSEGKQTSPKTAAEVLALRQRVEALERSSAGSPPQDRRRVTLSALPGDEGAGVAPPLTTMKSSKELSEELALQAKPLKLTRPDRVHGHPISRPSRADDKDYLVQTIVEHPKAAQARAESTRRVHRRQAGEHRRPDPPRTGGGWAAAAGACAPPQSIRGSSGLTRVVELTLANAQNDALPTLAKKQRRFSTVVKQKAELEATMASLNDASLPPSIAGAAAAAAASDRAKLNWKTAKAVKNQVKMTRRWHKDSNRWWRRLRHNCTSGHTLLAGLFFRGNAGFSRADGAIPLLVPRARDARARDDVHPALRHRRRPQLELYNYT